MLSTHHATCLSSWTLHATQLDTLGLGARVEEYVRVFEGEIDVLATLTLHSHNFQELIEYFHAHVDPFTVEFDEFGRI